MADMAVHKLRDFCLLHTPGIPDWKLVQQAEEVWLLTGTCRRRIPEGTRQHRQWAWLGIAVVVAVEDTTPPRVGRHWTSHCNPSDPRKQTASGKRHPIEAVVVVNKTTLAVGVGNMMTDCH